ncbi:MAG: GNAT family N-acetyltransferase [Deltaproteobacteria bacterium]|nr:GNAT family N-acetyltransferase [Deltaproteobacteria bacterium]
MTKDLDIHPLDELSVSGIAALDEKISGTYSPETWEKRVMYYIRRDPEGSFVAESGGQLVGFMLGEVRSGEFGLERATGWIEVLGVDPDFRGQAIGRHLAEAMLSHFRERGVERVCTLVSEQREGLMRFFGALGFEASDLRSLSLDLSPEPTSGESS